MRVATVAAAINILGACSAPSGPLPTDAAVDSRTEDATVSSSEDARAVDDAAVDTDQLRAVWLRGREVEGLSTDGAVRSHFTFTEPGGAALENRWLYGSSRFAIAWMTWFAHGSWSRWEVAVVGGDARVVAHAAGDGNIGEAFLGADGNAVLEITHAGGRTETVLVDTDGTTRAHGGVLPAGPRLPTGLVPVWRSERLAWLDPESGVVTDDVRSAVYLGVRWEESSIVFLAEGAKGRALVRSDGVDASAIETTYPMLYISSPEDEGRERWTTAPWLIAGGAQAEGDGFTQADILRIDFGGPTVTPIARPSAGWRLETRDSYGPRVDRQGRVYDVYRNDYRTDLLVTGNAGTTWEPMGTGYRAASYIELYGRGDTFIMHASDGAGFIEIAPFSDPPPGVTLLEPGVVQLLREETDTARTFTAGEAGWLLPSPSGREVAMFRRVGDRWDVTLLDLESGVESHLGTASADSVNHLALF
jgi:hypothetical protein